ncbi:MAG: pentapeptide repeat-containing protein [Hyphomonadaceae bacterium]|nr:MAG: pentapeptide repeat-containing protein [Caulobacteraceae bacterium]MBT9447500.1 pentapeptide repeat-containing protein [Hyphomonadaceae bacterium]TPW07916.1 MAG: pentapeptide repeat-containing protein [Alphaproteobacteria bacterium]
MSWIPRAALLATTLFLSAEPAFGQGGANPSPRPTPVGREQRFGGVCHGCDLSNRALPGVRIERGDFTRARFIRAFLVRMNGAGSTFIEADFTLANMTGASISDAQCDGATFAGAVMTNVDGSRAHLNDADFGNTEMPGADFTQARMRGASFAGAKAMNATFLRTDLRGASMMFARLDGADFTQAEMHGADLTNATLSGANLSTARGLTAVQLRGACGNAQTRLPSGLRIRSCR